MLIDDDEDAATGELENPELTPTRASQEPCDLNKVQNDTLETGEVEKELHAENEGTEPVPSTEIGIAPRASMTCLRFSAPPGKDNLEAGELESE